MKFSELFEDVEDWFWKLEFNADSSMYELFLGIPNYWVYSDTESDIKIEMVIKMEENSIVRIYSTNEEITIDDILNVAKQLVNKNKELEQRKEQHREEMENLKNILIEKEKNFLEYIDTVKEVKVSKPDAPNDTTVSEPVNGEEFIRDLENTK